MKKITDNEITAFKLGVITMGTIIILALFFVSCISHCEDVPTMIKKEALRQGLDPDVAISIATIESNLNPSAVGPKKEVGLFQILPRYSPVPRKQLFNSEINARIGIAKLIEVRRQCPVYKNLTYVICFNNGLRHPKYPLLHPYYKRFIIVMKKISLTKGKDTIVDDDDYENLKGHKWCAVYTLSGNCYAARRIDKSNQYLHRILLNPNNDQFIDHIDGNGLNNQRDNLRVCTQEQNARNRKKLKGSSQYKGVIWCKREQSWRATIRIGKGKRLILGQFNTEKEAALARDEAAKLYHGDFAALNFREKL